MKKITLFFLMCCLFLVGFIACGAKESSHVSDSTSPEEQGSSDTTTQSTTTLKTTTAPPAFLFDTDYTPVLPTPDVPETVYIMSKPSSIDDRLTAVSVQGVLAKSSGNRIIIEYDKSVTNFITTIKSHYRGTCTFKTASSVWTYLKQNPTAVKGYILTDLGDDSINVATSLAGLLHAVIVTRSNRSSADTLGLSCLVDVTDKDDAWLRQSEYFAKLNRDVAFMLTPNNVECLRDYAIFNEAYFFTDADTTQLALRNRVSFMNPGFTVLGWNNNCGEHGTVSALSALNGCLIPSDYAKNLATLASFPLKEAKQKTEIVTTNGKGKHTVCLVMSDGDNLQWILNDFMTSDKWYASFRRGKFPFSFGLPASTVDIASPALVYYYKNMKKTDEFIMELSGLGYTFPSKWKDATALADMQRKVVESMKRTDMSVLEILDDVTLSQSVVDTYYQGFLTDSAIQGALYIDYGNYAAYNGKIFWTGGKPIVTAKYRLWAGTDEIEDIAAAINRATTNEKNAGAYTFVTVHAWSGLDENGNLVANGNTMEAVYKLVSLLDEDVELVTPSVLIDRITNNVKH